jgi:hypothetical protein
MCWATFWAIFYKLVWSPCSEIALQLEHLYFVKFDQFSSEFDHFSLCQFRLAIKIYIFITFIDSAFYGTKHARRVLFQRDRFMFWQLVTNWYDISKKL